MLTLLAVMNLMARYTFWSIFQHYVKEALFLREEILIVRQRSSLTDCLCLNKLNKQTLFVFMTE